VVDSSLLGSLLPPSKRQVLPQREGVAQAQAGQKSGASNLRVLDKGIWLWQPPHCKPYHVDWRRQGTGVRTDVAACFPTSP
jgi:hypothetical protein